MSTTNPVFNVLITKGNQAVLPAGQRPDTLAPGQIGVFSYDTGLSLSAASNVADAREIFLAVGLDTDGDGATDNIAKSAGHKITRNLVTALTDHCSVAALGKIVQLSNFTASCETEYAIKIEVRNQMGYLMHGYNPIYKSFNFVTGCCDDGCTTGDCDASSQPLLALGLAQAINADQDDVFQAILWDTTANAEVDFDDVAQWIADNPTGTLAIRITSEPIKMARMLGGYNLQYFNPRGTDMVLSTTAGFECNGTISTIREMRYSEGDAYDIRELEYEAGGWTGNPGPYRLSHTDVGREIVYQSVPGTKYSQIDMTYDIHVVGGWEEYRNNLRTTVAIPCTDATTFAGIKAVLTPLIATPAGYAFKTTTCPCVTDEVLPPEEEGGPGEVTP